MKETTQNLKIYQEEVKQRHVSHWDWDYMTTSDIDSTIELTGMDKGTEKKAASYFETIWRLLRMGLRSTSSVERIR